MPHNEIAKYSKELRQCCRQVDEVNRLSDIVAEARFDAFVLNIGHDIGGQRNDGQLLSSILLFPFSNLSTGLVTVFTRHVEIALRENVY